MTVTANSSAGFVFDEYSSTDYKFVTIDQATGQVVIGHRSKNGGVVIDATYKLPTTTGTYNLSTTLNGNVVTVYLNSVQVLTYTYNALVTDGSFGLISTGTSSFDTYSIKTTDPSTTLVTSAAPPGG